MTNRHPDPLTRLQPTVAAFLETFRTGTEALDLDVLRTCFAETFLAGDASGAVPVPREAFLQALPGRAHAAQQAGVGRARLESADAHRLDDSWSLLTTGWSASLRDGGDLPMSSTFLLHAVGDRAQAVVYLNHQGLPRHITPGESAHR